MTCTKPVKLEDGKLVVPCGKCIMCRIQRSREWATRVLHELYSQDKAVWVTLTFADEFLPDEGVTKDDLQRTWKRLRKEIEPRKIKYFASGEYGEDNGRPHYHAIIFGLSFEEHEPVYDRKAKCWITTSGPIHKAWPYGRIAIDMVNYNTARYTADYTLKPMNKEALKKYAGKPFSVMSQGLGKEYCEANADRFSRDLGFTLRGIKVGLPRFYSKVLKILTEVKLENSNKIKEVLIKEAEKLGYVDGEDIFKAFTDSRMQKQKEAISRRALKK